MSDIPPWVPDTFIHFPKDAVCPVCKTNYDLTYWLMPIDGTTTKDGITEAQPVHMACTGRPLIGRLRYSRDVGIVYARVDDG